MLCADCGQQILEGARFCSSCGPAKSVLPAAVAPAVVAPPRLYPPHFERTVIVVLATLNLVIGTLLLGLTVVFLIGMKIAADIPSRLFPTLACLAVTAGVLRIACGVGLLRLSSWGRVIQIVLSCIGLFILPFGTLVSGLILYYMFRPGIRVLFSDKELSALTSAETQAIEALAQLNVVVLIAVAMGTLLSTMQVIGVVAGITVPNVVHAVQHGKKTRTMTDMRAIGDAVASYEVENGFAPNVPPSADAAAALAPYLEPTFIRTLPRVDGWQQPFAWSQHQTVWTDGLVSSEFSIVSYGKDGLHDVGVTIGPTASLDTDIYYGSSQFPAIPTSDTQQ